jgi:hypothetical protein
VNVAGVDNMIINSRAVANALLEKKGVNFSDRPSLFFLNEIVGWKEGPPFQHLGPTLNAHRRRLLQIVGTKSSVDSEEDTMREAALRCFDGMMENPQKLQAYIRR